MRVAAPLRPLFLNRRPASGHDGKTLIFIAVAFVQLTPGPSGFRLTLLKFCKNTNYFKN
jgi:hypothetical protein